MPAPRVLVVGAGATGACAALRLRQVMGREVHIDVWEKARGPGGRMSTNRQELGGANVRADMGAQYLSLDGSDPASAGVADMLVKAGVCAEVPAALLSNTPERPSGAAWKHLAGTTGGVNDALKKLLEEAGAELHCERRIASLDEQKGQWRARPFEGAPGLFDAVLLAVPGCGVGGDNLNKIHGGYEGWFSGAQNSALLSAQHDARWAFALFLAPECREKCEAFFGSDGAVERVVDDGPVHLLCYQSRKTAGLAGEAAPAGAVALVAHSTVDWAKRHARANGRDAGLLQEVAEHVRGLLGIAAPLSKALLASKVITWKQCQVTRALPASGGACMVVSKRPGLVLAGDYFTESNFGGCLRSGFAAAEAVAAALAGAGAPAAAPAARAEEGARAAGGGKGGSRDGAGGKDGGKAGKGGKGGKGSAGGQAYPTAGDDVQKKGGGGKGKGKGKGKSGSGYGWQPVAGA